MGVAKVGISVVERANVPFKYLWLSLILNYCLVTWFFWENGLSGKWIVAVGMPVSIGIGAVARRKAKPRARPKSTCLWQRPLAKSQDQGSPEADHELTDIELNTIARSERKIAEVSTTNAGDDSS